jgi:hypothetical protein
MASLRHPVLFQRWIQVSNTHEKTTLFCCIFASETVSELLVSQRMLNTWQVNNPKYGRIY